MYLRLNIILSNFVLANNFINFLKIILRFLIVFFTLLVYFKKICIIEHGENDFIEKGLESDGLQSYFNVQKLRATSDLPT